jgi:hypothetical protein
MKTFRVIIEKIERYEYVVTGNNDFDALDTAATACIRDQTWADDDSEYSRVVTAESSKFSTRVSIDPIKS